MQNKHPLILRSSVRGQLWPTKLYLQPITWKTLYYAGMRAFMNYNICAKMVGRFFRCVWFYRKVTKIQRGTVVSLCRAHLSEPLSQTYQYYQSRKSNIQSQISETSILNRVHLEANLQKTPLWKWHTSDINRRNTVTQVEYWVNYYYNNNNN